MTNYKWSNKKLQSFYKDLKIRFEQGDKIAEQDLQTLNSMLQIKQDLLDIKTDDILFLEIIEDIKKLAEAFCQLSLIKNDEFDCMPLLNFSIDDYLKLVYDFYKNCSPYFFNFFLEAYDKKNTNMQINYSLQDSATAYHFLTLNESFIQIFLNNTVLDLENLPHEYGHAVTFLRSPSFITNQNFLFIRELDGYSFQLRFLEYLIKNNILKEEAIMAKAITDCLMYHKAKSIANSDAVNIKNAVIFYSYLASIELSMKDNQLADDLLEKIITQDPQSIEEGIEILKPHIIVGKNIERFQKKLKKQLSQSFELG